MIKQSIYSSDKFSSKSYIIYNFSTFRNMDGKDSSPWCVNNLDEFIYYCCPECDTRNKSEDSFLKHALGVHPEAQKYLQKFTAKENFHMKSINEECLSKGSSISGFCKTLLACLFLHVLRLAAHRLLAAHPLTQLIKLHLAQA